MRNQLNNQNNTKDMNIKRKDKKDFNGNGLNGSKQNKKTGNATKDASENDKNNNLATNASNIIPNSSNHQSSNTIRKNSSDLIPNENNQNMNNQTNKQNKFDKLDKKTDRNKSPSMNAVASNQQQMMNRKSSAGNLDMKNTASMSSIVSNSLNGGIDSLYIVSDSELPDQEGDFKIVNYKNLRRKKQKKNSNTNQDDIRLHSNSQVNSGRINKTEFIKQNKKVNQKRSPNHQQHPATARGYESESDYCGVQERKKELNLKREILIDQDQKNDSISNTDSESSNSLTANEENLNNQTTLNNESSATNQLRTANVNQQFTNPNNLILTNPNILKSKISNNSNKISYAQVIKMNYSSNLNTNGASQIPIHKNEIINNNLVNNGNHNNLTQSTNSTAAKREAFKNSKILNDKTKTNVKSINSSEQIKKTDDKKIDKEQTKLNKKFNINSNKLTNPDTESSKEANEIEQKESRSSTANLSNLSIEDSSRTITADSNDIPNFSGKSSSFSLTPPVIMLDKSVDQDTQFVFGFFDENAKFQTNFEESNDPDVYKRININSVNFISNSREPVNSNLLANNSLSNVSDNSTSASNNKTSSTESNDQEVTSTRVSTSNLLKSSSGNDMASTLTRSNGNFNRITFAKTNDNSTEINDDLVSSTTDTPICAGTYIMNCEGDNTLSMRDSLTKQVHVNSNINQSRSTDTLANEIVSKT